jgi:VRR-NUC domain
VTEQEIQRAVFQHIKQRGAPDAYVFAVPNGGFRRPIEAAIMKGLGVKPGVPDIIAIRDGKVFALELKTETGRPTDAQLAAIEAIRRAGGFAAICYGLDRALACLQAWGVLRGRAAA